MPTPDASHWNKNCPSPYELGDRTHFPDWGQLTVWDAFFNNLTAGLMLVAAIAWGAGAPIFSIMLPLAMILALVLLFLDLGILVMDLADPWRFPHSLRVFRLASPLSVGVWGLSSYAIFVALGAVSWGIFFVTPPSGLTHFYAQVMGRLFTMMAAVGAVVVICYKGVVFSCSSQPGLKDARWLTAFMVADALLMGMGLYILLLLLCAPSGVAADMRIPFITLLFARSISFWLLWENVRQRARKVYSPRRNRFVHCMVFGLGGILALIACLFGSPGLGLASVLVLCAGVAERFWIIELPRPLRQPS